jgi:integrase
MAKRKGSLRLDHDSWYLRTYINGRQRSYRLGHRRDFISKDEVHAAADRKLLELRQVTSGSMARIPLEGFIAKWYLVTGDWRPSTLAGYGKMYRRYIRGTQWAGRPLWEYQTRHVQDFLRETNGKYKLSKATLRHIKAFLSGVFRASVIAGFRETNPVRDAIVPKSAKPEREVGIYTLAEVEAILAALSMGKDELQRVAHCAVAVAAFSGLRLAEIQGLTWGAVDFAEETIEVKATRWRSHTSEPKSKASKSWVPMLPRLRDALLDYQASERRTSSARLRSGRAANSDYEPSALFTVSLADLGHSLIKPTLRRATIKWKGWHAFRRSLATNLFELGVDDLVVSRILRHSGVQITRDSYIRSKDKRMTDAMERLGRAMGGVDER